jgi:hypothetical protein
VTAALIYAIGILLVIVGVGLLRAVARAIRDINKWERRSGR